MQLKNGLMIILMDKRFILFANIIDDENFEKALNILIVFLSSKSNWWFLWY